MSIEGLWRIASGPGGGAETLQWDGVVVLEEGRITGGGPVLTYEGRYEIERSRIVARVHAARWAEADNAGDDGRNARADHYVTLVAACYGDMIEGHVVSDAIPGLRVPVQMTKLEDRSAAGHGRGPLGHAPPHIVRTAEPRHERRGVAIRPMPLRRMLAARFSMGRA